MWKKGKRSKSSIRSKCHRVIGVVLLVADLYAMINMPQKFIILAIITALFLVAIYFLVDSISIYLMAEKNRKEEQYDSIFKSEDSVSKKTASGQPTPSLEHWISPSICPNRRKIQKPLRQQKMQSRARIQSASSVRKMRDMQDVSTIRHARTTASFH